MMLLLAVTCGVAGCQDLSPNLDVCGIESCDLDVPDATSDYPDINDATLDFWRPDDPGSAMDQGPGDEGVAPGEFRIDGIDPVFGASDGSTTVTLWGVGLDKVEQVWFGRTRSPSVFPIADGILNCVAPPGAAGPVTVRAVDRLGRTAISPVDFVYRARLRVESVFPRSGPSSGGTPITIGGSGFSSGVSVFVGGRPAISVSIADDGTVLAISPPGFPGLADVRVTSASEQSVLVDAWEFIQDPIPPTLPGIRIDSVTPARGPVSGGTTVTIQGAGFFEGLGVRIGALPADQVRVVSDSVIEAVTPPGTPGVADVVLFFRYGEARLREGFFYRGADGGTMGIFEIDPPDAAWTGGSLITVRGFGLGSVDQAWFGSYPAELVDIVSDFELMVRTPTVQDAGRVFFMVSGRGAAIVPDGFRFYDPYIYGGGVRGRPIEHNLNVTVYDGSTMARVAGARVIVGADGHTPFQGLTDSRGQISFGHPDLAGPLSVSATRQAFTAMTVAGFNAEDVTLAIYSSPSPENPTEGQPSEPTTPCAVSGRVSDYDKYFLKPPGIDGTAWVECFSSPSSMYTSMGTIPVGNRPDSSGRFGFTGRSGEFAIICRLMVQETGSAEGYPIRMGIRRHLKCVDGVSPEAVVSLDIPTDASLRFGIPNIPFHHLGVWEPRFTGGWHLGTDGYLPLPMRGQFDGAAVTFPRQPASYQGEGESDLAGMGFDVYVTISSRDSSGLPYSVVQMTGLDSAGEGALFSGRPGAMQRYPVGLDAAFRAFVSLDDGSSMAIDDTGRSWILEGDGLRAGALALNARINDMDGLAVDEFTAVGPAGRIIDVVDGVVTRVSAPFPADLLAIDVDSTGGQSIVTSTYLLNREAGIISVETVPAGARMNAVARFDDRSVFAVGPDGMIVLGTAGGEYAAVTAVSEDLYAVDGLDSTEVWAAGENGRVISIRDGDVTIHKTPGNESLRGILPLGPCDVLFFGDSGALYSFNCSSFTDLSSSIPPEYALVGGVVTDSGAGEIALLAAPVIMLNRFAGFPTITSPAEGAEWDGSGFDWASGTSWGATHCQGIVGGAAGNAFWQFITDGSAEGVDFPDFGRVAGYDPAPPGPKRLNITCSRTPGFDIDNYDYRSLGTGNRETYSVDLGSFY